MGVPSRQVAVLSVGNYEGVVERIGDLASEECVRALRGLAASCGVDDADMRTHDGRIVLLRLDGLEHDELLDLIERLSKGAGDLVIGACPDLRADVRVGAISERAMRSLINDTASDIVAYMNHADCKATLIAGDDLESWQRSRVSDVVFLSHEQLKRMDPTTGMLKHDRFMSLLQDVLDAGAYEGQRISLLYFDIDDFKSYNRAFGHAEGDELLLFVAHQIVRAFPADIVSHLSVDRFAVLTSSDDVVHACAVLHELTRSFRRAFAPEIKCGVFPLEGGINAHEAIDCAKLACDSIKGRYDVACRLFDESLRERMFTRRYVARHAEQAVGGGWIRAFAQPVVNARTGEPCGFEALARWDDPDRGLLSPAMFIPTLEDAHLIHKLDTCVVEEVCSHLADCRRRGVPALPASVNLSRLDFELCDIVTLVTDMCAKWDIPHDLLALEVTESALDSSSNLRDEMDRFRAAGFEVWMDDFGCGYSSLNLLKDYEFDVLKVDMEFLRDMEGNVRSKTIVTSVLKMARSLGIRTLVEGVETVAQRDFLREAGCDMMQGYLFGKPRPLAVIGF